MNDQLFEMLMSLFEQALNHRYDQLIEEQYLAKDLEEAAADLSAYVQVQQHASQTSMRILTRDEQLRLTKPATQFLFQLMNSGVLNSCQFEDIMQAVEDADVSYVTVAHLRDIIYQVLAEFLPARDLIMLEFALNLGSISTTMH